MEPIVLEIQFQLQLTSLWQNDAFTRYCLQEERMCDDKQNYSINKSRLCHTVCHMAFSQTRQPLALVWNILRTDTARNLLCLLSCTVQNRMPEGHTTARLLLLHLFLQVTHTDPKIQTQSKGALTILPIIVDISEVTKQLSSPHK